MLVKAKYLLFNSVEIIFVESSTLFIRFSLIVDVMLFLEYIDDIVTEVIEINIINEENINDIFAPIEIFLDSIFFT